MNQFSDFLEIGRGERFISFSNSDNKRWVLPIRNMRTAINLYQPSGIKGKLIKYLMPYVYRLPLVKRVVGFHEMEVALNSDIERRIRSIFNVSCFEFSVFLGTPSVHQKTTIQISNQNTILGYCKFTDNDHIKIIFKHEKSVLNYLYKQGINDVPECLYCGVIKDSVDVFVQTTSKTRYSKISHHWSSKQELFLNELRKKSSQKLYFKSTDFYHTLLQLKENLFLLSNYELKVIEQVLDDTINEYIDKEVEYAIYHGDFTPWNMFIEKDKLFVFDWEYAQLTYPPYLDYFHFFTQTAIFERHWDERQIFHHYSLLKKSEYINDMQYSYYLLDIICRFALREKGHFQGDIANCMSIWIKLLSLIN